ncbi:MAG TPA: ABC transporter substrate-binding protein [Opitutaceae bacterium]|jgi:NitT/TauT family transport system substrate-binding protein|nr:ABC transporter substrate-binding protein [Opitutaceae bacterium]
MKFTRLIACLIVFASLTALRPVLSADTLKIGYSDWPGYTVFEIANQKGWFKDAGVDVQMVWFDYGPSIDAFAAGKIDADCIVASDAMGAGATGAASKFITIIDYSEGSDMIIGKPGINSIKDLKGQKVAVELGLVEHFLLLEGLKRNGLSQSDVTLVNTPTNNMPQTLASGSVAAVGAWYPISSQALVSAPGSKPLFTSADAKGLIYDVLAVNPTSLAAHHDDWAKVAAIYYKCVAYLKDPATRDDAIKIMAAKVQQKPEDYAKNVPGTHFETLAEAKANYKGDAGAAINLHDSMALSDKFSLDNAVYKVSQKPEDYISSSIVLALP